MTQASKNVSVKSTLAAIAMQYFEDPKRGFIPLLEAMQYMFSQSEADRVYSSLKNRNCLQFKKWQIFSDYYFEDDRPNHVMTFTALAHNITSLNIRENIRKVRPSDFKKTRSHSTAFTDLIKTLPIINFSIVLQKGLWFGYRDKSHFLQIFRTSLEELDQVTLHEWAKNKPQYSDYYQQIRKRLRCLVSLIQSGKKIDIIRRLYGVTTFMSYFGYLFHKMIPGIEKIGWFPDRDSINDVCDEVIYDLFNFNYFGLTNSEGSPFMFAKATATAPEGYKELTRIPDHITASLSDFNFATKETSKLKFHDFLNDFAVGNETTLFVYRFRNEGAELRPSVIKF